MVHRSIGHHHLHRRKRIHLHHEPYPHPIGWKGSLDRVMYGVGLLGPLMMVPQIIKIYAERDATSIALSSWLMALFPAILWVVYGGAHKDKVIIICNVAWMIAYLMIVVGAIIY